MEALSHNFRYRGKAMSIPGSDCVSVALVIQNAKRVRPIVLSSVASLAVPKFFHIFSYLARFSEKVIEHRICVAISSASSIETFLILGINERNIIINCVGRHVNYQLLLSDS
jgi:hypothetical protein